MNIDIYTISKSKDDEYEKISNSFIQMSKKWATVTNHNIFSKVITKNQSLGQIKAKMSYNDAFDKYVKGYSVVLDPNGKNVDSIGFAKLLKNKHHVSFFIAGAFGFDDGFIKKCNISISLTPLTLSHKIAKVLLFEQIYRGLSINNNHPYHKI